MLRGVRERAMGRCLYRMLGGAFFGCVCVCDLRYQRILNFVAVI